MSRYLPAPFRIRSYRFQWPADLLTSWALEMETLILGWYVLVETQSVILLTVFGALQYVGTLIAPMLGVASDRIGHRNLLTGMRTTYAAVAVTLTVLAFADMLNPVLVCVIAAVSGIVRPSDMGLRGAMIADSMPPHLMTGAMSFSRITGDIARITGALTGAGLFAVFGLGPAYIAITAFYAASAFLTWRAVAAKHEPAPDPAGAIEAVKTSAWRDLKEGIVYVWQTPKLLTIIWLTSLINFTTFPLTQGLLPYVAKDIYGVDETGLGYLVASVASGALIGALVLSRYGGGLPLPRLMIGGAIAWYVLIVAFAQTDTLAEGVVALLLVGAAQSVTMVCHTVILLQAAGQKFRGRILGVRMLVVYNLPLGLLVAGALVGPIGFAWTASLYGLIGIVCTVLLALHSRAYLWHAKAAH
jgi:MFS family permease